MIGLILAATLANGTYTYKTTYNGADLGTSTVRVQNNGTLFAERISGSYLGTSANADASLMLGADLTPLSYKATGTMGGQPLNDSASIKNGSANVTTARGETTTVQLTSDAKHFVVVDLGTIAGFVALPEQVTSWNNAPLCAVLPSMGQSLILTPQSSSATGGPAGDAAIGFENSHAPFTIWYNPKTLVPDLIAIPSQNLTVTRIPS